MILVVVNGPQLGRCLSWNHWDEPRDGHLSQKLPGVIVHPGARTVEASKPGNVTVVGAEGRVPIELRRGTTPGSLQRGVEREQALDPKMIGLWRRLSGLNMPRFSIQPSDSQYLSLDLHH